MPGKIALANADVVLWLRDRLLRLRLLDEDDEGDDERGLSWAAGAPGLLTRHDSDDGVWPDMWSSVRVRASVSE